MNPSISFAKTDKERHAFEFYLNRTSIGLAGPREDDFWRVVIMQRVQFDAGVRHAILALASLHEDFENSAIAGKSENTFALRQYNLAIREHFHRVAQEKALGTTEAYLPCLLFVFIEMLRANYISAVCLARKAAAVPRYSLATSKSRGSKDLQGPESFFERILRRIEIQAIGLIGHDTQNPIYSSEVAIDYTTIPAIFLSVSEAWNYLEFYGQVYGLSLAGKADTVVGGAADFEIHKCSDQPYLDLLNQWNTAFNSFLAQRSHCLTLSEKRDANILRLHQTLNRISLEVGALCLPAEEQTIWDNYQPVFKEALALATMILDSNISEIPQGRVSSDSKPSFSLGLGIVGPLYDIARRCRDPTMRRKAINMLRTCRRREGLWDSSLAVQVAERIVAIEEDGFNVQSSGDVPSWRRIFNVTHIFSAEENRWHLHYERKASASRPVTVQIQEMIA